MITLLIASRNLHKLDELRAILGAAYRYLTLDDFPGAPAVGEDAGTFAGNATRKAVVLAEWLALHPERLPHGVVGTPLDVLADDSGLEVDALGGAPGVKSARFAASDASAGAGAGGNAADGENNRKLLRLLEGVPLERRTARFRCVLALAPAPAPASGNAASVRPRNEIERRLEVFEGVCAGRIGFSPRGASGFGYDPLFVPEGYESTFGELGPAIKNRLSHRARALARLSEWLVKSRV